LDVLGPVFGSRLRAPAEFVGLGDMSRGGLLLRCVRENSELAYVDALTLIEAAGNEVMRTKRNQSRIISREDAKAKVNNDSF
jgi:hypothetical protein